MNQSKQLLTIVVVSVDNNAFMKTFLAFVDQDKL